MPFVHMSDAHAIEIAPQAARARSVGCKGHASFGGLSDEIAATLKLSVGSQMQ